MSDQLNVQQSRIIDPILSTVALGFKDPDLIGSKIFPVVPVDQSGGQVIQFDRSSLAKYNTTRSMGGRFKRVDFGFLGLPYAVENHGLEAQVPSEQARDTAAVPGIDIAKVKVNGVMRILWRELEVQQATLATTAATYQANHVAALSGTSQFSNAANDPVPQIEGYREIIRGDIGIYPNTAWFGPKAWIAFKNNPAVRDRVKYNGTRSVTAEIAAELLEVDQVLIGRGVATDSNAVNVGDMWGNNFGLCYTNLGSLDAAEPSFGYTYLLRGQPLVMAPYWENQTNSWVYQTKFERIPVTAMALSGFLAQNVA